VCVTNIVYLTLRTWTWQSNEDVPLRVIGVVAVVGQLNSRCMATAVDRTPLATSSWEAPSAQASRQTRPWPAPRPACPVRMRRRSPMGAHGLLVAAPQHRLYWHPLRRWPVWVTAWVGGGWIMFFFGK
jgi:hypothetical protein